jgi:hypothetical protein
MAVPPKWEFVKLIQHRGEGRGHLASLYNSAPNCWNGR